MKVSQESVEENQIYRLNRFQNMCRSLYCIPQPSEMTDEQFTQFRINPLGYFCNADLTRSLAIWREIEKRQR